MHKLSFSFKIAIDNTNTIYFYIFITFDEFTHLSNKLWLCGSFMPFENTFSVTKIVWNVKRLTNVDVYGCLHVPKMAAIRNEQLCLFLIIAVYLIRISHIEGARLSDPKILLPYHSSVITNFTLHINLTKEESHVQDNCYTWFVTRQIPVYL